MLITFRRKNSF